jgi:hypothetical protein
LDTCHSGNIMGKRRGALDTTAIVNELASAESGVVVLPHLREISIPLKTQHGKTAPLPKRS